MKEIKVAFVSIKSGTVIHNETADISSLDEIVRRINKCIRLGYDKTICVYGDGVSRDISYPMTPEQINNRAKSLFDAMFFDVAIAKERL